MTAFQIMDNPSEIFPRPTCLRHFRCHLARARYHVLPPVLQSVPPLTGTFRQPRPLIPHPRSSASSPYLMSSTSRPMAIPRIPYTTPLPSTPPIPPIARTLPGAIAATTRFLLSHPRTLLLTGAGLSVASGLSDYRGQKGTYTLNRQYRPIFYPEFISSHAARQRYWARSYFGWPVMRKARPNRAHAAIERLRKMGRWSGIITQSEAHSCARSRNYNADGIGTRCRLLTRNEPRAS